MRWTRWPCGRIWGFGELPACTGRAEVWGMTPKIPSPPTRSPVPQFKDRNPGCVNWLMSHTCVEVLEDLIELPGAYRIPMWGRGSPKRVGSDLYKGSSLCPIVPGDLSQTSFVLFPLCARNNEMHTAVHFLILAPKVVWDVRNPT